MPQHDLIKLWEEHTADEFVIRNAEATLNTMVDDAYVNHIPTMTGGHGKAALLRFYSTDFIPVMPPDTKLTPISRTVGEDQLVDEIIFSFTHTQEMPWMLPGVPPTNRRVEVAMVAGARGLYLQTPNWKVVRFRNGKLAHEHIYWDQASVLKQLGLLNDPGGSGFVLTTSFSGELSLKPRSEKVARHWSRKRTQSGCGQFKVSGGGVGGGKSKL